MGEYCRNLKEGDVEDQWDKELHQDDGVGENQWIWCEEEFSDL